MLTRTDTELREGFGELGSKNYRRMTSQSGVGSRIASRGDIDLVAHRSLQVEQSDIDSSSGDVLLKAGESVLLTSGEAKTHVDEAFYAKDSGLLSSTTLASRHNNSERFAVSSNVSGDHIVIAGGEQSDVEIKGSHVVSDSGTLIRSGRDVSIVAAENVVDKDEWHYKKESGLLGTGGIGFMIGSRQTETDTDTAEVMHTGSMVGNLKEGDTTIIAKENYTQSGSAVNSLEGDVNVLAKRIDVRSVNDRYSEDSVSRFKQKGLTVALSSPVINAAMAVVDVAQSAKDIGASKNSRVNAMAAANTAFKGYQAADGIQKLQSGETSSSGLTVSITYGEQKNKSESHIRGEAAQASHIQAGGKANLIATGSEQSGDAADTSEITITGSDVAGKAGTNLIADNDVNIEAAGQRGSERSKNTSSGWNAGVAITFGEGVAFGFTAGGNRGKGHGNGDSVAYRNSHVGDGDSATVIQTGNKLDIKGGQVLGDSIKVDAQDLSIASLQDSAVYDSKQKNISAQVTVGYGASASGSFSKSKIKADHLAVSEQSGILAGDEGFQVAIQNHTDLKGGIVTSTAKAEENKNNRFTTGTISTADIANHSRYDAKGFAIGGGFSISGEDLGQGSKDG